MIVRDVMTRKVLSVAPGTPIREVAAYMLRHGISAVPVIDRGGALLGIVSEGDLHRRPEAGTLPRRAWWLDWLASSRRAASEFRKTHGATAADVMTRGVSVVTERTPLAELAALLDRRRIKRAPVVAEGKVVGIVSRADLVRAFLRAPDDGAAPRADDELRAAIERQIKRTRWARQNALNIAVHDGHVDLSGAVESPEIREAVRLLVERVPGVRSVKAKLAIYKTLFGA